AKRCGQCGAELPVLGRSKKLWYYPGQGISCLIMLAAIGIVMLAIIVPQYRLYQMQINLAKEAIVKSNMRSLRVALDQFAAEYEFYPATLEPIPGMPGEQSLAGLALELRRLRNPIEPLSPAVAPTDPPDWRLVKPGQVVYVPLGATPDGRARSYIIYGMGKKWPLTDVMRGGYGQ
ncbi:MAG: hypothetical protein QME74_03380, partial [Candidatus Edwardsbacteria bacterium]|nr:hypothetical protein [Candidatus Edwardsbacteria bacterium]